MMKPKVSVIIPIYGVEKYIGRCAKSLFEQTLDSIEYIFVDDYSPDNSIQILQNVLKEYPGRKSQTRIVRMPTNSGQAAVRRHGIQLATGEYIIHCDSDDWVELDMYETMYNAAKDGDYDIVICDYFQSHSTTEYQHVAQSVPTDKDGLMRALLNGSVHGSVWNKMVNRTLYQNYLYFPEFNMLEDLVLTLQLVTNSKSFLHIDIPLYHYYVNINSITQEKDPLKIINRGKHAINNFYIIEKFLNEYGIAPLYSEEINNLKYRIKNSMGYLTSTKEGREEWNNIFPELGFVEFFTTRLSLNDRIKYMLSKIGLFSVVRSLRQRF